MTQIELIMAEIERLKGICMAQIKTNPGQVFPFVMEMTGYDKLLSFIATLDEPSEDLGEEVDDWYNTMGVPVTTDALIETARHFYELGLNARRGD